MRGSSKRGRAARSRRQPGAAEPAVRAARTLPLRRVLSVVLYPSVYLPLFITSARRELMLSADFFCFLEMGATVGAIVNLLLSLRGA